MAKVFLLALQSESKSATYMSKGSKAGRWREGRRKTEKQSSKRPEAEILVPPFPSILSPETGDLPSWVHPAHLGSVKNSSD